MPEQPTSGSIRPAGRVLAGAVTLLLALIAGAALVPPADAASPLVAQWHMDAADGAESSGNNIATNVVPGTQVVTGRFGGGLQAGSGGADLIVPQTSPKLAQLQPAYVSLVVWFKASGFPGLLQYLVSDGGEGAPNCGGSAFALYTGYHSGPGLQFYVRGAGGLFHIADAGPGPAVFDGNWHMAAGTFDGTNTLLYVDGKQITAAPPTTSPETINYTPDTEKSLRIGEYSDTSCGAGTFTGQLDEVKVYDRALTATEIARMAAAPGPTPPDLVPDDNGASHDADDRADDDDDARADDDDHYDADEPRHRPERPGRRPGAPHQQRRRPATAADRQPDDDHPRRRHWRRPPRLGRDGRRQHRHQLPGQSALTRRELRDRRRERAGVRRPRERH